MKAGKLTKEEAAARLAALKKTATTKSQKKARPKDGKLSESQLIEAAFKAGKLTKEEAAARLAALKKTAATKSQKKAGPNPKATKPTDFQAIAEKLSELVNAGLLSEVQAKAMLAAARKVSDAKKSD